MKLRLDEVLLLLLSAAMLVMVSCAHTEKHRHVNNPASKVDYQGALLKSLDHQ